MSYPWNSFDTLTAGDLNAAIAMAAAAPSETGAGAPKGAKTRRPS